MTHGSGDDNAPEDVLTHETEDVLTHESEDVLAKGRFDWIPMADVGDDLDISDLIPELTLFDQVLKYGLMLGAVFQLICIFAVVFIPRSEQEQVKQ